MTNCPNCKSDIKEKLFSSNQLISPDKTKLINTFTDKNFDAYCDKCAEECMYIAGINIKEMKKEIEQAFEDFIFSFPALSIENPKNWDYKIIKLMSETISVGPGVREKITGEELCLQKLKAKLFNIGGNAIIGTRIQYDMGEQTQLSNYRILSIYGTAIKVKNTDSVFPAEHHQAATKYSEFDDSRKLLKSFNLL